MKSSSRRGLSCLYALPALLLGCTNESAAPADKLVRDHFPSSAQALLDAPLPASALVEPDDEGIRLVTQGRVEVLVPLAADEPLRVRRGAFAVEVRERGRLGQAMLQPSAVVYGRQGGSSIWRPTPTGCEEWIVLEDGTGAGDEPVLTWDVEGAFVAQDGRAVVLQDAMGQPRMTVHAPLAYTRKGMPIGLRLEARGDAIALYADPVDEPVMIDPDWTDVAPLGLSSYGHQGITLADGRVLVVGQNGQAEIYDEATNMWKQTAPPVTTHFEGAGALLADGRVLLTGGFGNLSTAEVYDPGMDKWTAVAPMLEPRVDHTATRLPDGRVLIAGGTVSGGTSSATAEIYDPATNMWSMTGSMATGRHQHTAALLQTGKVLAVGGAGGGPGTTAELYDPATGKWTATGAMVTQHFNAPRSVVLKDGKVLVLGANVVAGDSGLYDPTTNTWSNAGVEPSPRIHMSAALLLDGRVLAAGGYSSNAGYHKQAEIWDPQMNAWTLVTPMNHIRSQHSANRLPSGAILQAGGFDGTSFLTTAEVYSVQSPLGSPCTVDATCASGFCVANTCCNSACDGPCQACTVAMGATADGACTMLSNTPCDDGDACTNNDQCSMGTCTPGASTVCMPSDACHLAGMCDPMNGVCSDPVASDGAPCPDGTCVMGQCISGTGGAGGMGMGGAGGMGGDGGVGGSGGTGGSGGAGGGAEGGSGGGGTVQEDPGCGCRVAEPTRGRGAWVAFALALAGARLRRRRAA